MRNPRRPSPAFILALVALFVALAGVAYALERNSVKSKHIKNGQVKTADLADGSVLPDKLGAGPAVRAQKPLETLNNDQILNNGDVPEALRFDQELYDDGNFHTGGTYDVEQSKFFVPRDGLYEVSAGVIFSDPGSNYGAKRQLFLTNDPDNNPNGDEVYLAGEIVPPQNPGATVMNVSAVTRLQTGNMVQAFVSHDAGSNLVAALATVDGRHFLSLTWLGP